jgi:hypothetical protein
MPRGSRVHEEPWRASPILQGGGTHARGARLAHPVGGRMGRVNSC